MIQFGGAAGDVFPGREPRAFNDMGGGDDGRCAAFGGDGQHVQGFGYGFGAIVDGWEDMAVDIEHINGSYSCHALSEKHTYIQHLRDSTLLCIFLQLFKN